MKKRVIIILIILLAAAAGGYFYFFRQDTEQDFGSLYRTHTVTPGDIEQKITGSGKIDVRERISVYLNVSQIVSEVYVREGDRVAEGDILVGYDMQRDYDDLLRKLYEAELQLINAQLNLDNITRAAGGNELLQYQSDVTTAQKNITDAELELITAQKGISDAEADLNSTMIRITQQQMLTDDAETNMSNNELLLKSGGVTQKNYDDSVLAYKNAVETLNEMFIQKAIKEKNLEIRIIQLEFAEQRLETRIIQAEYAEQKLDNSQNKLNDESSRIQYDIQQNIIALNRITIEQINADIDKLIDQSASPVTGVVTSVGATKGGIVSKGTPVVTLSDTSDIIAKFDVSEYDAPLVSLGQKVYITTSALPETVYRGAVVKISGEAIEKKDSSNNEVIVPVEIVINNMDDRLKIGYSIDIEIVTDASENVMFVPVRAVFSQDGDYFVYVITDNTLVKTPVTPGMYGERNVEIKSGLFAGDIVVTNPEDAAQPDSVSGILRFFSFIYYLR